MIAQQMRVGNNFDLVTVSYNGTKSEFRMTELDIALTEDGRYDPTDVQVKDALLNVLGTNSLDSYEVDRYGTVINLHPAAELG